MLTVGESLLALHFNVQPSAVLCQSYSNQDWAATGEGGWLKQLLFQQVSDQSFDLFQFIRHQCTHTVNPGRASGIREIRCATSKSAYARHKVTG